MKSLFGALLLGLCSVCISASAQSISPVQLEQLRNLTPEQRQQLQDLLTQSGSGARDSQLQEPGPIVLPDSDSSELDSQDGADGDGDEPERLKPNDTIVVDIEIAQDEPLRPDEVVVPVGRNIYQLDGDGRLKIDGADAVLLAGLTTQQAQLRLSAEPVFAQFNLSLYLLPLDPVGTEALKRFGYELFSGVPTTFAPVTDIPVPLDYVVGPGDEILLVLFGQQNAEYRLVIGRDGMVNVPDVGPVVVTGMRFDALREELTRRIEERFIGVNISLTMGELRSMRIFVLGDVNQPGSYTVSSLTTMTNALFVSGGISQSGSMRKVQLKRNNAVVGQLDLYDLLLKGNTNADRRLKPGDVIYVPPVGDQVWIEGQVNRPAIYEMKGATELKDVVRMAGGLAPSAFKSRVPIERFNAQGSKSAIVADLTSSLSYPMQAGDHINVLGALNEFSNDVQVRGHVKREIASRWTAGLRLLDVLPGPDIFLMQADQNYVLVRRVSIDTGRTELLSANWREAFENRASSQNFPLQAGDTVYVFSLNTDRAQRIKPLIEELERQANYDRPAKIVSVRGGVRSPGRYPYQDNMRASDLVRAAGGTVQLAYLEEAELTRLLVSPNGRRIQHLPVNLSGAFVGGDSDVVLQPDDELTVKTIPLSRERNSVKIVGEIEFPGTYSVSRGERISDVVRRSGGVTPLAFLGGSVFMREDLKERERAQLENLERRMRAEITSFTDIQSENRSRADTLLMQLESTEPVGRLVIDLSLALQGDPEHDVVLEDGDKLVVPALSQEVTVIGEVQNPTSHIFEVNQDQFSYIQKSGGSTRNADKKRIYVIRADGRVVAQAGSNWYRRSGRGIAILPGDTIVVPVDVDRISNLTLWTTVSQAVYNIAVSAAVIGTL